MVFALTSILQILHSISSRKSVISRWKYENWLFNTCCGFCFGLNSADPASNICRKSVLSQAFFCPLKAKVGSQRTQFSAKTGRFFDETQFKILTKLSCSEIRFIHYFRFILPKIEQNWKKSRRGNHNLNFWSVLVGCRTQIWKNSYLMCENQFKISKAVSYHEKYGIIIYLNLLWKVVSYHI